MTNGILDSGQKIITDGLVLNYDIAQLRSYPTTGTAITDLSGNSNNATLINGVAFNSGNGGSLVFDGINDYVNCGNIINYTNNLTLNSWVKINSNSLNPIISKWDSVNPSNRYLLFRISSNTLQFFDSNTILYNGGTISSNIWHMVSVVINSANSSFYINGIQSGALFNPTLVSKPLLPLALGSYSVSLNQFLTGNISQIQIYNRALSTTEILQNFNANRSRYGL